MNDGRQNFLERSSQLDELIEAFLQSARIPGAGVAIVDEDGLVFAKGYGYRDLDL